MTLMPRWGHELLWEGVGTSTPSYTPRHIPSNCLTQGGLAALKTGCGHGEAPLLCFHVLGGVITRLRHPRAHTSLRGSPSLRQAGTELAMPTYLQAFPLGPVPPACVPTYAAPTTGSWAGPCCLTASFSGPVWVSQRMALVTEHTAERGKGCRGRGPSERPH